MTDTPSAPRVAPMTYNARGNPVHTWTLTPSHITDPVHCILPPDGVLPVIFVPGIMGSNLKSKPEEQEGGESEEEAVPVWRLDAGFVGKNMWLALNWINKKAGIRQKLLHPDRVEVDNQGAVPKRAAGTVMVPPGLDRKKTLLALSTRYQERGWGEVSETSYHAFLLWLEETLNSEFLPHRWPQFDIRPEHLHSVAVEPGPTHITRLKPDIPIGMPGLGATLAGQLPSILSDELVARGGYRMPVHACGYNWLDSNEQAAIRLAERIDELMHQYGRNCQQVILVTHSMGGLVARRCAQLPGMGDKIAGVVHGVMPATGAPVAYRRCKVGMSDEDPIAGAVIGPTGQEVTAVFAQAPGALQLLPTQDYAPGWLRLVDNQGVSAMPRQPVKDPYEEIYLRRDRWWGLLREEWLAPKDGDAITWKVFADNIRSAKEFHQDICGSYHPQTYVYYGSEDKHPSFESITWQMQRGSRLNGPHGSHPDSFTVSNLEMHEVRDDGRSPVYVGGQEQALPSMRGDPDAPVKTVQTSFWELHCQMQDGSGDGTVPVSSGSAPIKHARNGEVRQQIKAPGFDHEASYANPLAQHFTLYSLIKIAAKAKRPLCVS
ncbi:alpha/beta fold hydrolase [Pseudomonas tolaasii]|uniref:Alpha/beta fold hydrolase n=2 Tax=Pseudomonas tolaasii TaxID=29442 RepID=A0A7Y8AWK7_PSETO|nr:alpha/beta fold hydrolase [Pseudomonas tolaasii]ARB27373.1 alpha/beta hydrolase [Pseudomonas tolaasii]KAB0467521.1 alpha/beta fold hydrolase [Pseudomonas tolaasii]MBY8943269.1 alpha/beta fold hydrolase [Pseudomonas tolaasii]NWC24777.1 alpha/beta fold hydrolase [Pseudomonas tolaasii]NWC43356.1 alpha/beta fold hydrolase [Pseudomonas tolaasii]